MTERAPYEPIAQDALREGATYRVRFDDCCVGGEFTSPLAYIDRDADGDMIRLGFSNGVKLHGWLGVEFAES